MDPGVVITRTTSKKAKKAYQKRQPGLSEKEKRQIARSVELDRRAEAIREKERRKKENAKKREEKEAKQREERRRMGIGEPVDEGYVSPRQTRMEGFFSRYGKEDRSRETTVPANEHNADDDEQSMHLCLEDGNRTINEPAEDPGISDDQPGEQTTDRAANDASVEFALPQLPVPAPAENLETIKSKRAKRKRKDLSRASSAVSAYSQPMRMPLRTMDPNFCVDKNELRVPPSQNTVVDLKQPDVGKLKAPLPDLPWPKPAISSPTLAYRTQRDVRTQQADAVADPDRLPHNTSLDFSDFDLRSSQMDDLECLAKAAAGIDKAETPPKQQEDLELPVLPVKNQDKTTDNKDPAQAFQSIMSDMTLEDLAELLSDDSVLCMGQGLDANEINEPSKTPTGPGSRHARANSKRESEDKDSKAAPYDVGSFEFRSSDFSPLGLTQILLPLSKAEKQDKSNEVCESEEDEEDTKTEIMDMSELDGFGISTDEADALESAALGHVKRSQIDAIAPPSPATQKPVDHSEGDNLAGRQGQNAAQTKDSLCQPNVNVSFGFGSFDFSSQELRSLDQFGD